MSNRRKRVMAVLAVVSLVLSACGTRLDHNEIVGASARSGVGSGVGTGTGMGGSDGLAGGDDVAGGTGTVDGGPGAVAGPGSAAGPAGAGQGRAGGATGSPKAGGPGKSGGGPIVIGTIGVYSGGTADTLGPGARALQAWAATVNSKGGLAGREVKVIVMDDGGDPSRSRAQMQQLVEQNNVVAVVSAMTLAETYGSWKDYVEKKGVPVIGGLCGMEWSQPSPVIFRQCPTERALTFGTAKIGAKYGKGKNFGGLFCTETDQCAQTEKQLFADGDAKRAGLNPVYSARISLFSTDYTSECLQARNKGVELLTVAGDPGTVARVAASCNRQNYHPQFLQYSATVGADTVTKQGLGDMLLSMPVFPFAGLSTPAFAEFAAAWKRYGGQAAPGPSASLGWSSAKLFEKAATLAGGDISRAGLLKALYKLKNERLGGLTVPLTLSSKGTTSADCVFVMRGDNGKWVAPTGDKPLCW